MPATGCTLIATLNPGTPGSITQVAWTPDNSIVATSDKNGTTYLWNPVTGHMTGRFTAPGDPGQAFATAISPDGSTLAVGYSDGSTYLWSIASGHLIATLPDPGSARVTEVNSVAFSPNGRRLVSADNNGNVFVWRVGSSHLGSTPVRRLPDPAGQGVWSAAFSSDGTLATGDYAGNIYLWNVGSGSQIRSLAVPDGLNVTALAFSPDGSVLAAGSGTGTGSGSQGGLYLFSPTSQASQASPDIINNPGAVWALSFSGSTLAAADDDGQAYLFNVHKGSLTTTATLTLTDPNSGGQGVGAMDISPNGQWLVTGDTNGRAYVWSQPPTNTEQAEANSINNVLMFMANSRGQLGTPTNEVSGCFNLSSAISQLQGIASSRQSQLASAQNLPVGLLPNGAQLKSQLMAALRVSLRADRDYIAWGQDEESAGCGSGYAPAAALNGVNTQATASKEALVGTWDPIAPQYNLPQYSADQI